MVKVLKQVNENKVVIIFIILIFIATLYMGVNERRLDSIKSETEILEIY